MMTEGTKARVRSERLGKKSTVSGTYLSRNRATAVSMRMPETTTTAA